MAEYVKWRFTKLRTGVTMALFGLLAGFGLRVAEEPHGSPAVGVDPAASIVPGKNSITGTQIKNHSLTISDFKSHEVASFKSVASLEKKVDAAVKTINANEKQIQGILIGLLKTSDANATFLKIDDAASQYLKADGTATNSDKVGGLATDQLVQGHGSVITGELVPAVTPAPLLTVPGTASVTGAQDSAGGPATFDVTNISNVVVDANVNGQSFTLQPGKGLLPAVQVPSGGTTTVQLIPEGGSQVVTLTVSSFADGSVKTLVGQALVGTP